MKPMAIPESQNYFIRIQHQETPDNSDEYRIMLRLSIMLNQFFNDSSTDADHSKCISDLRRQSTVKTFFDEASILDLSFVWPMKRWSTIDSIGFLIRLLS